MVAPYFLSSLLPPSVRLVPDVVAVLGTGEMALFFLLVVGFATFVASWAARQGRRNRDLISDLGDARTQLGRSENARRTLAARLGHQARNPLSGIVGLAHALGQTDIDDNQRKLINSIQSCAEVLGSVCEDTLDSAAGQNGGLTLRADPFDLASCIQDTVTMMALAAGEKKSQVVTFFGPGIPARLIGDRARLQQIIIHLVARTLRTAAPGTITVAVVDLPPGRTGFLVHNQDEAETKTLTASAFEPGKSKPFTQPVPAGEEPDPSETAIWILAAKMGGDIGVCDLEPGKVAHWFTCQLPADTTPVTVAEATELVVSTKSVLVVEDISYNAAATQAMLAKLGFTADIAVDGPTALEQLKSQQYDLVFMDGNLPGMSGAEVTRKYRATETAQHRALIFATTADTSAAHRDACAEAGMDGFIGKPLTPEKISLVLREHEKQRRENLGSPAQIYIEADQTGESPDLSLLQFLSDVSNGGIATQIDRYLVNLEIDRQRAYAIATSGDTKHLSQVAHRLVSHADALRYEPLRRVAISIHAEAAIIDQPTLHDRLRRFDDALAGLTKKLEAIRASMAPS